MEKDRNNNTTNTNRRQSGPSPSRHWPRSAASSTQTPFLRPGLLSPLSSGDYSYLGPPAPAATRVPPEAIFNLLSPRSPELTALGSDSGVEVEFVHALDNCTIPFKYDLAEDFMEAAGYKLFWNTARQQQEIDSIMQSITNEEFEFVSNTLNAYFNGAIQVPGDQDPPSEYVTSLWNTVIWPCYFRLDPQLQYTCNGNGN